MSISKILTDLYATKQNRRIKNTSASIVYNVLVVKKFSYSTKKPVLK